MDYIVTRDFSLVVLVKVVEPEKKEVVKELTTNGELLNDDIILQNRMKLAQKMGSPNARKSKP